MTVRNQWAENKQLAPQFPQECCGKRAKFHPGASLSQNSSLPISMAMQGLGVSGRGVKTNATAIAQVMLLHMPGGAGEAHGSPAFKCVLHMTPRGDTGSLHKDAHSESHSSGA